MSFFCHHLDKFEFINLDLIEEVISKKQKCIVLIGGSTSSGKSYCAKNLDEILLKNNYKPLVISTDNYNKGISGIITDKVNTKYFDSKLPRDEIINRIRPILEKTDFEKKFDDECCSKIRKVLCKTLSKNTLDKYIEKCQIEIKHLNFDEPDVYDLKLIAKDINKFLKNEPITERSYSKVISEPIKTNKAYESQQYNVLILEGIYVLSDDLYQSINKNYLVTNFIQGSPKSLFLRRVIRDNKFTSAPSYYTINMYFNNIVPSYNETILPSSKNADVIFNNEMSFKELREGTLYKTKDKILITNPLFLSKFINESKILETKYERDYYFKGINEPDDFNNLLRLREISLDNGKTYMPSSLIHKGAPKSRKDGVEIRPINILLKEGEFQKSFDSTKTFIEKVSSAGFIVNRVVEKIKIKLLYENYKFTISNFKGEGIWLEFSDNKMPVKIKKLIKQENK